jgi:hypothetical protein
MENEVYSAMDKSNSGHFRHINHNLIDNKHNFSKTAICAIYILVSDRCCIANFIYFCMSKTYSQT